MSLRKAKKKREHNSPVNKRIQNQNVLSIRNPTNVIRRYRRVIFRRIKKKHLISMWPLCESRKNKKYVFNPGNVLNGRNAIHSKKFSAWAIVRAFFLLVFFFYFLFYFRFLWNCLFAYLMVPNVSNIYFEGHKRFFASFWGKWNMWKIKKKNRNYSVYLNIDWISCIYIQNIDPIFFVAIFCLLLNQSNLLAVGAVHIQLLLKPRNMKPIQYNAFKLEK